MNQIPFLDTIVTYPQISQFIRTHSAEEITQIVSSLANISSTELLRYPMGGYSKGGTSGAYYFVLRDLKKNIVHYDWVYDHLHDDISRKVFSHLLRFRIVPDMQFIRLAYDGEHPHYFDDTIVSVDENEVFVDCGGFHGETTEFFVDKYKIYKHIYLYEPSSNNFEMCRQNLKDYPQVTVRHCGVGEKSDYIELNVADASSSFIHQNNPDHDADEHNVEIAALDIDIQEKVTFIKMDVEGFEIPALLGAKNHIMNDKPKLAISLYHVVSDIWEIPRLIYYMNPDYKFYIRHYDNKHNWETVLYAIPAQESNGLLYGGNA